MADLDELALAGGDGLEDEFSLNEGENNGNDTSAASLDGDTSMDDPELAEIKARVREMEEEANKLRQMQSEVDKQMKLGSPTTAPESNPLNLSVEEKMEVDARSIYVGNVDYGAAAEELEQHFHGCGSVNRVTILCNKFDGTPKGFAYIEFADKDSVQTAMALDESLFRGRQIKVMPKRTNRPGISSTNRAPRGRFRRGRGGFRGRRPRYRRANFFSPY